VLLLPERVNEVNSLCREKEGRVECQIGGRIAQFASETVPRYHFTYEKGGATKQGSGVPNLASFDQTANSAAAHGCVIDNNHWNGDDAETLLLSNLTKQRDVSLAIAAELKGFAHYDCASGKLFEQHVVDKLLCREVLYSCKVCRLHPINVLLKQLPFC